MSLGQSSFREVIFHAAQKKQPQEEDTSLFTLQKLSKGSNIKFVDQPVSSDGMIMRTSFKIRFEVTKRKWFKKTTVKSNDVTAPFASC